MPITMYAIAWCVCVISVVDRLELPAVPARFEGVVAIIGRFIGIILFHPRQSGDANFLRSRRHAAA